MIDRRPFGRHPSGRVVDVITCENRGGLRLRFLTYGGIITAFETPDRTGAPGDVVLGFDTLDEYLRNPFYFGALIGRHANRIARGRFVIDGHPYDLTINDPPNHLHGGALGFHQALWTVDTFDRGASCGAVLSTASAAGDDGYPGTLNARVTYTLLDTNEFVIEYAATTDAPTPVNLTQHSYFNLAGARGSDVLGHDLEIAASSFTPVDDTLIPLGAHRAVQGTPFDFRAAHPIGRDIGTSDEQLRLGGGYDHNWVLDGTADAPGARVRAAVLSHGASGRRLEVLTTERGLQVYAGGTFAPGLTGKGGVAYPRFGGIAVESQAFPDSPNQPGFPSTILAPGEAYASTTSWRFSVGG